MSDRFLIKIDGDASGAVESFGKVGAEGQKAHNVLIKGAEELGIKHRELHTILRGLGSEFGIAGEASHALMFGPMAAGVLGVTEGISLLREHFKKLDEQATESAKKIAAAFGESIKAAQDLQDAMSKLNQEQDEYNKKLDELHRKQAKSEKDQAERREGQEAQSETDDSLRSMRAQAARAQKLAKGAGATPEQLEKMRETAARAEEEYKERRNFQNTRAEHERAMNAAAGADKAAKEHAVDVDVATETARQRKADLLTGSQGAEGITKRLEDAIASIQKRLTQDKSLANVQMDAQLLAEAKRELKDFTAGQSKLKQDSERADKELADARAKQMELEASANEKQKATSVSAQKMQEAQRSMETGRGERAADIAAEHLSGDKFGQTLMAAVAAQSRIATGADIHNRTALTADQGAVASGRDALSQHGLVSKALQDRLLNYLIANAGDLAVLDAQVKRLEEKVKGVHNQ